MDANRFYSLSRSIGMQRNRRDMLKTAAAGTLAIAGVGAFGRAALGQEVSAEAQGFKGDKCKNNSDCKKGLTCDNKDNNNDGKCEYKSNCGGKKNQACKKTKDCCNGKNLRCKNRKCKRKN